MWRLFKNKVFQERFIEDIPLLDISPNYQAVLVSKYLIEQGIYQSCQRSLTGLDEATNKPFSLGGQKTSLGNNVRLLICHLVTSGLSYWQTSHLLETIYGLRVSSGEITNIP